MKLIDFALIVLGSSVVLNTLILSSILPFVPSRRKYQIMFDIAYSLVWEAERLWGEKTGHIKRAHVKARLYVIISTMPVFRNSILKEDLINEVVDNAYQSMRKYADEVK